MSSPVPVQGQPQSGTLDFNALFFDTNVLIRSNWPAPSVEFENLCSLAASWKVGVFIPEPVERETEAHWVRKVSEKSSRLISAANEFERLTRSVGGTARCKLEPLEELVARYRGLAKDTKERLHISTTSFAKRPLEELFDLAIRYEPPFVTDQEGKGFQDAVILSSIYEYLEAHQELAAVLVTSDSALAKVLVGNFMPRCAKAKLIVRTVEDVWKPLFDRYWDESVKKPWEEERVDAQKAVEAILPELQRFISKNLTESMLKPGIFDKVIELRAIEKVDVFYVLTPMPDPPSPTRSVRMAVAVQAHCRVLIERDYSAIKWLSGLSSSVHPRSPQELEEEARWIGGVEATADVKDGQYTNLQFHSLLPAEQLGQFVLDRASAK